ncbi:MAG: hypothetical protein AAGD13_00545 [Pseudomonadota bacterium]
MIDPFGLPMAEPHLTLRGINALFSFVFAPAVLYAMQISRHHPSIFYRIGMASVAAGLASNVFMVAGVIPLNLETWLLTDLGVYLVVASLVLEDWKARTRPERLGRIWGALGRMFARRSHRTKENAGKSGTSAEAKNPLKS